MSVPHFTIDDLGAAMNSLSDKTIDAMVNLAKISGGDAVVNDTVVHIDQNNEVTILGVNMGKLDASGHVNVLSGSLVNLQFKVDQMMAVTADCTKNGNKVSQSNEVAAR